MKILPATNYCRYFPPFSMGHLWPNFFFQGMNIKMYHYQFLFPLLLTFDAGWKSLRSKSPSKLFKCEFRPVAPIVYWTHICNNDIDRNSDSSDMWSNYCVLTCWCFWCPPPHHLIKLHWFIFLMIRHCQTCYIKMGTCHAPQGNESIRIHLLSNTFIWNLNQRKLNKKFKIKKKDR